MLNKAISTKTLSQTHSQRFANHTNIVHVKPRLTPCFWKKQLFYQACTKNEKCHAMGRHEHFWALIEAKVLLGTRQSCSGGLFWWKTLALAMLISRRGLGLGGIGSRELQSLLAVTSSESAPQLNKHSNTLQVKRNVRMSIIMRRSMQGLSWLMESQSSSANPARKTKN